MLTLMRRAWFYAEDERWKIVLIYGLFIVASVIFMSQPMIFAHLVEITRKGGPEILDEALLWSFWLFMSIVAVWVFHGPARVIERRVAFNIYKRMQMDLYKRVCELPLRWHQNHHSGDTINRVTKSCRALFLFCDAQFMHIQILTRYIASLCFLAIYAWWIAAITFAVGVLILFMMRSFDKFLVKIVKERNENEHKLSATVYDTIGNMVSVLTLRLQGRMEAEIDRKFETMRRPFWRETPYNEYKWGALSLVNFFTQAMNVGLYIAISLYRGEAVNLGAVVAIFQYQAIITQVFFAGAGHIDTLLRYQIDLQSAEPIFEDHEKLFRKAEKTAPEDWNAIAVTDLCFTHHENEEALHHLRHLNFEIKRGEKIALIGQSGSGKSTLLTLLRGLYDAGAVTLTLDGARHDNLAPLSAFTTLVPQDAEIFENTIRYNITLGVEFPDDVVADTLDMVAFASVAGKLPKGLDSDIRERGVNLSGGEKQRLALARGLLAGRDSTLILLDEPTSNVDLATEKQIFDRVFDSYRDKTLIASIHRLHLLPRFDKIILMDNGQIAAMGTFDDLLKTTPTFQRLWCHHLSSVEGQKG